MVQISQHSKILYENAFGYADRDSKINFNSHTRFNIASGGKLFTGTLIMQLVERGKIDLHKPIQKIQFSDDWSRCIDVEYFEFVRR